MNRFTVQKETSLIYGQKWNIFYLSLFYKWKMCCLTTMLLKLLNYVFYLSATSSCRNGIETVNHSLLQCPQLTLKMFVCCQPLLAEKGYSVGQVKNFTFSKLVSHDKKNICQALIFTLSYMFFHIINLKI